MSGKVGFFDLPVDVLNIVLSTLVNTVSYKTLVFLRLASANATSAVAAFETTRKEKLTTSTKFGSILDEVCPALRRDDAPFIEAWVASNPPTYRYEWMPHKKGDFTDRWIRPQNSHVLAYACKVSSNPRIFECLVRMKVDPMDPCVPELESIYEELFSKMKKAAKINNSNNSNADEGPYFDPEVGRMVRRPRGQQQPRQVEEESDDSGSDSYSESLRGPVIRTEITNPWINMVNLPETKNDSSDHYSEACGARSAIHLAIDSKRHPRIFKILLSEPHVDVKRGVYGIGRGERSISMAARSDSPYATEYVRLLLERGADPNVGIIDGGVSPLHFAMKFASPSQVVELLIAHGAKVDDEAYDYSGDVFYCFSRVDPLHFGLKNPVIPLDSIKALVRAGADLSRKSRCYNTEFLVTRLGLACWFMEDKRPDVIEFLLDQGVNPNEPIKAGSPSSFLTKDGGNYPKNEAFSIVHHDTALHYMHKAMWGRKPSDQVVDMMIRRGASMAARNHNNVSVSEVRVTSLQNAKKGGKK